jgi:hypothetical protein
MIYPVLDFVAFMVVIVIAACALLGGLYLLFRNESSHDKHPSKQFIVSNLK